MANVPDGLQYTKEHEYVKATDDPNLVVVGITDYAQGELGDIVYLDLPKAGASFDAHGTFGTIEAVKAVSDLFMPLAGEVVEVNAALDANPGVVNSDPYGEGWMIRIRLDDPAAADSLLDAAAYGSLIGQ